MTPLEFMKKELALMAGEYDKHLADCALAIAEEYDREGHSGHSIGWFSTQFRTHTLIALKTKALGESTWLDHFKAKEVQLGAGDLTELATGQFYRRVAVLDKFEIRPLEDLRDGMVLGNDVLDKDGRLLVAEDTMVTVLIINRLRNFSGTREVYIKVEINKLDIKSVVELENGEKIEVTSNDIRLEYSKERFIIKEKFNEMQASIKKSFNELSRNNTGTEVKREVEAIVEEIKDHLSVNIDLLNEILDVKAVDEYLYIHSLNVAVISNLRFCCKNQFYMI
jgi:gas vesicle protein